MSIIINKVVKTVFFVTFFSGIERITGFIYRIFLSREIGSEGLGVYQIALTVFGLLLTVTSSGIPITVSRLMTRYKAEKKDDLVWSSVSSGIFFTLVLSVPIVIAFFVFQKKLSFLFSDERCIPVLLIVLPGLIITSVYAVIRGSFWGEKDFVTYSVIELLEEIVMLVLGVALISLSRDFDSKLTCTAIAVLGSYVFSFVTSVTVFLSRGKKRVKSPFPTLKPLVTSSVPITGMRGVSSLVNFLIAVILPLRLIATGMTNRQAVSLFGTAYGMAIPILFMPSTLIGSLAVVLVPELSENYYKKQTKTLKSNVERALEFSVFISLVISPVLCAFGKNLGTFFYSSEEAGNYLSVASYTMLPMSISLISTSMLNSLNSERKTLMHYIFGAAFMLLSITILPRFTGVYSLAIGLFGQFSITAACNLACLKKKISLDNDFLVFTGKALIATAPAILFGKLLNNALSAFLPVWATCFIGCGLTCFFACVPFILIEKSFLSEYLFRKKKQIQIDKSNRKNNQDNRKNTPF
ncbi:MAG: oligosaccharide flippase family protein [Christensenellaceae bacterium]|nr:oligosaccharide flippase family protein [Christensenellaceae bacterium]MDD6926762.1 oligosaccharide flippase family protein [bacterium]MDY2850672.1 oligosaccharide flippase family protein [Christensenellaceae bacterium]